MKCLRSLFLIVDFGFIAYWTATALHLIPAQYLYQDYTNELVVAWNWSFAPLDIAVSITGLLSLYFWRRADPRFSPLALISLCLTTASGFQAISYWAFRRDFDPLWWTPNLFLLIYPWFFIVPLITKEKRPNKALVPTPASVTPAAGQP